MDERGTRLEQFTGLNDEEYQRWSPSGMHSITKKYKLL